jgi:hypothetical protein
LDDLQSPETVRESLLPLENALNLPQVIIREGGRVLVGHGRGFGRELITNDCPVNDGWVQVMSKSGELLALAEVIGNEAGLQVQPRRVLCHG